MLTWTLDTSGVFRSTDERFLMYPERRPENDNRLTWTLIDKDAEEGVENGFDTHTDANDRAERLADRVAFLASIQLDALHESVSRLRDSGLNRHDEGLILALSAAGENWWAIARMMGITDGYVRDTIRAQRWLEKQRENSQPITATDKSRRPAGVEVNVR